MHLRENPKHFSVVLAIMHLEPHGGVADQMTTLALKLPQYGVQPVVIVRNPLSPQHPYVRLLKQGRIAVWAMTDRQQQVVTRVLRWIAFCLLPVALVDTLVRRKSLAAARASVWGALRRVGYLGLDVFFLLRLAWARLLGRACIAHFRNPDSWFLIPWAARLGYRTLYTEDTEPQPDTEHYYLSLGHVADTIHAFTAVSRASADHLQRYIAADKQIAVIPNMVEKPPESGRINRPARPFVVGFLGRLAPQKNVSALLAAARIFLQEDGVTLSLFGDGPLEQDLKAQAVSLTIADKVHFAGAFERAELPQVMGQIDLLVLPSLWEGFGVVLVEGMAYGKPCVATAVGGATEVVVDGVTGLLVPPDDAQAMAQAILRLMKDEVLYARFASAARERYEACYTPERVTPQYVQLYRENR